MKTLLFSLTQQWTIISTINADVESPGAKDIIYNGDMGLWAKLANTLKLRMLVESV